MQVERTPGSTRTSLGLEQRHKEGQEKVRLQGEAGGQSSPEASVFVATWAGKSGIQFGGSES